MLSAKDLISITLLIYFLTNSFVLSGQPLKFLEEDSLLKKAKEIYLKEPDEAIKLTKLAYTKSRASGLKTQEIKSLNLLSVIYWENRRYKEARRFAETGLHSATKYKIDSLSGDLWVTCGLIDYSENKYEEAMNKYRKALHYFLKSGPKKKCGITYMNIGMCEKRIGHFDSANQNYFKAATIMHKIGDEDLISGIYNSIGNGFLEMKFYDNAFKYYNKALVLARKLSDNYLIAQSLNNLGYAYLQTRKPDSSIKYLLQCLALRTSEGDSAMLVLTMQNLGAAFIQNKDAKNALPLIKSAVLIAKKKGMADELLRGNIDLAEVYTITGDYSTAKKYIDLSESQAAKLNGLDLKLKVLNLKSFFFERTGRFKEALFNEREVNTLRERIFTLEKIKAISQLEIQFDTKRKTAEITNLHFQNALNKQMLTQQKHFMFAITGCAFMLLILLLLVINSFRIKQADNLRIQTLMKELHHRIQNNLQILSGFFTLQLAEARDEGIRSSIKDNEARLNSMNLIHQKLYTNEGSTKINLKEYLIQLTDLLKVSFGSKQKQININTDIEDLSTDADKAVPIGLIINELVTNSFKYAFDKNGGEIYICFRRKDETTCILTVNDNGCGIPEKRDIDTKPGFGIKLVNMMTKQLNAELIIKHKPGTSYIMQMKIPVTIENNDAY